MTRRGAGNVCEIVRADLNILPAFTIAKRTQTKDSNTNATGTQTISRVVDKLCWCSRVEYSPDCVASWNKRAELVYVLVLLVPFVIYTVAVSVFAAKVV